MPLIELLRHGEMDAAGLLLGRTDRPLSQTGWQQFERQTTGRAYGRIITSPLVRAREPAEQLANERRLELLIDPDWAELDFGAWDGRRLDELRSNTDIVAGLDALYHDPRAPGPPDGESWQTLSRRIDRALRQLAFVGAAAPVLVVTHAGPMRAALAIACDIPFERLWVMRIGFGTRVVIRIECEDGLRLWGEILEITQP